MSGIRSWSDEELSARLYQVRSELDLLHEQFSRRRSLSGGGLAHYPLSAGVALAQARESVQEAISLSEAGQPDGSVGFGALACADALPSRTDASVIPPWMFARPDNSLGICAWCQQEQGVQPKPDESHGICPHHKTMMLERTGLRRVA